MRHWLAQLMRFRGEFVAAAIAGLVGWLASEIARRFLDAPALDQLMVFMVGALLAFMLAFSIKIKRDITGKMHYLHDHMIRVFGPHSWNLFAERSTHFAAEKNLLAKELVGTYLPAAISRACTAYEKAMSQRPKKVIVIVDSGTTLTPVFPEIKKHGFTDNLGVSPDEIYVYTNSVSGVNEFNLANVPESFPSKNLILLGGNPLTAYRATTGDVTLRALDAMAEDASTEDTVIVGLLTANWITVGPGYEDLNLCAKGPGHLDFKKKVHSISHSILVVSPLGKLLKDRGVSTLNEIMRRELQEQYDWHPLESEDIKIGENDSTMRREVTLLTSFRRNRGALLFDHAHELFNTHENPNVEPKYALADKKLRPIYTPRGTRREQQHIEVPHHYIWQYRAPLLSIHDPDA